MVQAAPLISSTCTHINRHALPPTRLLRHEVDAIETLTKPKSIRTIGLSKLMSMTFIGETSVQNMCCVATKPLSYGGMPSGAVLPDDLFWTVHHTSLEIQP